jgi:hypothetical protein
MIPDTGRVIVKTGDPLSVSGHCFVVYHREFPEVRGEGDSPEHAAARLVESLTRTLDSAPSDWRRGILERAIEDIGPLVQGRSSAAGDRPKVDRSRAQGTAEGG